MRMWFMAGLLGCAIALPTSAQEAQDKNADPATLAYEKAETLRAEGKLVEAERAYQKVWQDFPRSKPAVQALDRLWRIQAKAGKAEDAFRHRLLWWQENLRASSDGVPVEGVALRSYEARTRWEVAEVCADIGNTPGVTDAGKLARARQAETQYVKLIKDYPESPYARQAQETLETLRRYIVQEETREKLRKEVETVVDSINTILERKDPDAFFALLSASAKAKYGRDHVVTLFKDPTFVASRYKIVAVRFNADSSKARVEADATLAHAPTEKPRRAGFDLVNTHEGWRIE